jgi:hypothetical protein
MPSPALSPDSAKQWLAGELVAVQRSAQYPAAPVELNQILTLDFMADALYGGRWFRTLNRIEEGNR